MRKLSSSSSDRRSTFLRFQPPAIGEEEVEAVAETLRSGWLTSLAGVVAIAGFILLAIQIQRAPGTSFPHSVGAGRATQSLRLDTAESPPMLATASRTVSLPVCGSRTTCSPAPAKSVIT